FRCSKRQMLRRHFDRRYVLVAREDRHFIRGRDMQHMDALACFAREAQKPRGTENGCFRIAPDMMRFDMAEKRKLSPLAQTELVFRMNGSAAANGAQHAQHIFILFHKQRAGGRTHENLDATATRLALYIGEEI